MSDNIYKGTYREQKVTRKACLESDLTLDSSHPQSTCKGLLVTAKCMQLMQLQTPWPHTIHTSLAWAGRVWYVLDSHCESSADDRAVPVSTCHMSQPTTPACLSSHRHRVDGIFA